VIITFFPLSSFTPFCFTTGRDGKPIGSAEITKVMSLIWTTTDIVRRDKYRANIQLMDIPKVPDSLISIVVFFT
jgi:hypothetical protein